MRKLSVLLGLLAGIAVALQAPSSGVAEAVAVPMGGPDCIFCDEAECPGNMHDAYEPQIADANYTRNGGVHLDYECYPGTCDTLHGPKCSLGGGGTMTMVDIDRLRGSIKAKDGRAVKNLLANHTQSTALNVERSAVQVLDCEGAVIAHFPVGQKLLDRVSAE